ncbi:MAG: DUF1641 domain-containing protein [Myxococcota bacterium]
MQASAPAPVGAFGLLRALGEPDVQRAVGFALAVARRVGVRLRDTTTLPARTSP